MEFLDTPLCRTVFGSHFHGTATESSDYDFKEIYLPDVRRLITGTGIGNTNKSSNDKGRNSAGDIDIERVPLQTFMKHFYEGQTYALELAFAAINDDPRMIVAPVFVTICRRLAMNHLTGDVRSIVAYAYGQAYKYGIKGTRYRVLAELAAFVDTLPQERGTRISDIQDQLADYIKSIPVADHKYLCIGEYSPDGHNQTYAPAVFVLDNTCPVTIPLTEFRSRIAAWLSNYGRRAATASTGADFKALSHSYRIIMEATELVIHGKITLPHTGTTLATIMQIKRGEMEQGDIVNLIQSSLSHLDDVIANNQNLKQQTPETDAEFGDYLLGVCSHLYDVTVDGVTADGRGRSVHALNKLPYVEGLPPSWPDNHPWT